MPGGFAIPGAPPPIDPQAPKPSQRVTAADGTVHVFPAEATPEMIAQAIGVKPPASTTPNVGPPPVAGRGELGGPHAKIGNAPPSIGDSMSVGANIGLGLAKGAATTGIGVLQLLDKYNHLIGGAPPDPMRDAAFDSARARFTQPAGAHSTAQAIGKGAEQLGEFLIPGVGEEKAAVAGLSTGQKALAAAKTAGMVGVDAAARTAAQTGGDMPAVVGAGATGAVASGVLQAGAKALRGNFGAITPEGQFAVDRTAGKITPAQAKDSQTLSLLENILQGSLFGGGRYRQFLTEQQAMFKGEADRLLSESGGAIHPEVAGENFQGALDLAHTTARRAASVLYDDVDQIAGDIRVPIKPLADFIEADTAKRGKLAISLRGGGQAGTGGAIAKTAEEAAGTQSPVAAIGAGSRAALEGQSDKYADFASMLADAGAESAEGLTFRQAHELRSALGAKIALAERSSDPNATSSLGFYKKLRATLDTAMTTAAGGPTSPVRQAYDTATSAWKAMAQTYQDSVLAKAAETEPRLVAETLIQPKRIDEIVQAREAMGGVNSPAWQNVTAVHAQNLLMDGDGIASGKQLMDRLTKLSPETMEATYGRNANGFYELARVMEQVQRPRAGVGKVAISLAQGGAAIGLVTNPTNALIQGSAGTILLGPAVLSRIMLNPQVRRWLIQGVKEGGVANRVTGPVAQESAAKLLAWLVREGLATPPKGQSGAAPNAPRDVTTGRASGPGSVGSRPMVGQPPPPPVKK